MALSSVPMYNFPFEEVLGVEVENSPFSDRFMLLRFERRQFGCALANANCNNFNSYRAEWKFVRKDHLKMNHTPRQPLYGDSAAGFGLCTVFSENKGTR